MSGPNFPYKRMIPPGADPDTSLALGKVWDAMEHLASSRPTHAQVVDAASSAIASIPPTAAPSTAIVLPDTGVTAGTYGDADHVGQFTVDLKGRITAAANVALNAIPLTLLTTLGQMIYAAAPNTPAVVAPNTTVTPMYLRQIGTGAVSAAPSWSQVAFSELSGSVLPAQMPALTGDVTMPAGTTVTTLATAQPGQHTWGDVQTFQMVTTATAPGTVECLYAALTSNPAAASSAGPASIKFITQIAIGNSQNHAQIYGIFGTIDHHGTGTLDNGAVFYSVPTFSSTGGTNKFSSFKSDATIAGACTVVDFHHFRVKNATFTGGGSLTNQYGLRVEGLTAGTNNYVVKSEGAGLVDLADTTDATSPTAVAAVRTAGGLAVALTAWATTFSANTSVTLPLAVFTATVAPAVPAAGKANVYVDSTSKNLAVKDDAGVIKHGVQTKAAVATYFLTAIADDGTVSTAQPSITDISGLGTMAAQNANAVAITGGTIAGLTGLAIRDTSAAFDVTLAATSSTALTAGRTLTLDMVNASRTFKLAANLTVSGLADVSGTNSGDVTLTGENYLTIAAQVITMHAVDLSGTNATGILAAARFPILTGDVTTTGGSLATALSTSQSAAVTWSSIQTISNSTASTGPAVGALVVAGGIGCGESISATTAIRVGISTTAAGVNINMVNAAGQLASINFYSGSTLRWLFRKGNATESGADAGSPFEILARTDAGGGIDTPFSILRAANGAITITRPLVSTGGTFTASSPVFSATQTWNAAGVTFTGIKLNITDTASASASLLLDLQVAAGSKFKVDKAGNATFAGTINVAAMPVFVASGASHAAGAVPDPGAGAGTTHFLREDATWAIPSVTPGGSDTQFQYNNAGALAGSANLTYVSGVPTFAIQSAHTAISTPSAPASGLLIYAKTLANRVFLHDLDANGVEDPIGVCHGHKGIIMLRPGGSTTLTQFGMTFTSPSTISHPATASTNYQTAHYATKYLSAASISTANGYISANQVFWRGNAAGMGGFYCVFRFSQATNTTGGRAFVGLQGAGGSLMPSSADPSGSRNLIGVGYDAGDANTTNWWIYHADGATTVRADLGVNAVRNTTDVYELILYCKPNDTQIWARFTNLSTGVVVLTDTAYSTNIPANTVFMYVNAANGTGTTSTAQDFRNYLFYGETTA